MKFWMWFAVIMAAAACGMIFMGALIGENNDPWVMLSTDGETITVLFMPENESLFTNDMDTAVDAIRDHFAKRGE